MTPKDWIAHHGRQLGTWISLAILCLALGILSPNFLTVSNLLNVAQQTTINAIIAVGMTCVIIMSGIDLSVGSILAFSGILMAMALKAEHPWPLPLALAVGLLSGSALGAINGLLVTVGKLPPFIATLGMMSVARGAALVVAGGKPISGFGDSFRFLANGQLLAVPMPVLTMIAIYALAHWGLTRTRLGVYIYAIGGNETAARLSGINVGLQKIIVYALCGLLSALASVIVSARLDSAQPTAGGMYELDAIAATVIGGTSLMGGTGNVLGTLVGALIMGVLRNGLNLLDVSSYLQQCVIGSAIILAVLLDMALKRRKG